MEDEKIRAHLHDPTKVRGIYLPPGVTVTQIPKMEREDCACGKRAWWKWNDGGALTSLCHRCLIEEKLKEQRENIEYMMAMGGIVTGNKDSIQDRVTGEGFLTETGYKQLAHVIVMTNKMVDAARMRELANRRMQIAARMVRERAFEEVNEQVLGGNKGGTRDE